MAITHRSMSSLNAARLLGAMAVAILGQFAIDTPQGYFGGSDVVTDTGLAFCLINLVFGALACWGIFRQRAWAPVLALTILSLNIGSFIPCLATDPILAAVIIGWQLVVLGAQLFSQRPAELSDPRMQPKETDEFYFWLRRYGNAVQHLSLMAIAITVAIAGFELSHHLVAFATSIGLHLVVIFSARRFIWLLFKHNRKLFFLLAVPILTGLVFLPNLFFFLFMMVVFEITLLAVLLRRHPVVSDMFRYFAESPALFVVLSFLLLIAIGAMVLSFPAASATESRIDPMVAFFTSVSSVCVTGLVLLDTGKDFSLFGQAVIAALIQLGGLGIMVLYAFTAILFGGNLGLRGERALGDVLNLKGGRTSIYRLTYFIVLSTLLIEAVGAGVLAWRFVEKGLPWQEAIWRGVFHAISAFCNAGFALQTDSLGMFKDDPLALTVFSALIALGGVGFMVLASLWFFLFRPKRQPISVHVKLVLLMTLLLNVMSILVILGVEWNGAFKGMTLVDKIFNGLLHGVTLRTAGFNTLDMTTFKPATIVVMLVFMFIGAAPGGTGGGIKVTTAGVLFASLPSLVAGNQRVRMFGRNIAPTDVFRSAGIAVLTTSSILFIFFALLLSQKASFESLLFEVVSAIGTVGLSLGATAELDRIGRYLIILAMFIGRVGPLTAALALSSTRASRIRLPEESLLVG